MIRKVIVIFVLGLNLILAISCMGHSNAELREVCRFSLPNAQLAYIHNGSVYIPDGADLIRISKDGEKQTIYRNTQLGTYMGFGTSLKAIDTRDKIIIFDENDTIIGEIPTNGEGQPILSANDKTIVLHNVMEEIFRVYDMNGSLIREFTMIPCDIEVSYDGNYIYTSGGFMYDVPNDKIIYVDTPAVKHYRIFDNNVLAVAINSCTLYNSEWNIEWKKPYVSQVLYSIKLNEEKVVIFFKNRVECLNRVDGSTLWSKEYDIRVERIWQEFAQSSEFAVFQTEDGVLHVLKEDGQEIIQEKTESVIGLSVQDRTIVYQAYDTTEFVVLEIVGEVE